MLGSYARANAPYGNPNQNFGLQKLNNNCIHIVESFIVHSTELAIKDSYKNVK